MIRTLSTVALLVLCLTGCGDGKTKPNGEKPKNEAQTKANGINEAIVIPTDRLVTESSQLVRVDKENWLDAGYAKNWQRMPASRDYVVRFYREQQSSLPQIEVTKSEPYPGFTEVTDANHAAFRKQAEESLGSAGVKPKESPLMLQLNDRRVVRWVEEGKWKNVPADIQVVQVIVEGVMYDVRLYVLPGQIPSYRDAGYASAAALKSAEDPTKMVTPPAPPAEEPTEKS